MLTDQETRILDLERGWFKHQGRKDEAIHAAFGWTATRYYAVVNALLDRADVEAADPMLVRRLRRLRARRESARRGPATLRTHQAHSEH